ncbi:hypothetical protein [Wenxinia saemankumensis]|uniref:DUF1127 domain-containing protein n=1 Tax=Wenxinia saemankumensis TaxID=1447782 RepID=A0A1M6CDB6_9RHOB|nr:hypothetical protein [Wenxinia saemankumensis]SHI58754.1 hypothetical protein SAMN05444417_1126 [Wenxinia saemankumensis]
MSLQTSPTIDRTTARTDARIDADLDAFFAGLGMGVNAYELRQARRDRLVALAALSDAELAARGIDRDGIPAHVFSDLLAA